MKIHLLPDILLNEDERNLPRTFRMSPNLFWIFSQKFSFQTSFELSSLLPTFSFLPLILPLLSSSTPFHSYSYTLRPPSSPSSVSSTSSSTANSPLILQDSIIFQKLSRLGNKLHLRVLTCLPFLPPFWSFFFFFPLLLLNLPLPIYSIRNSFLPLSSDMNPPPADSLVCVLGPRNGFMSVYWAFFVCLWGP